MRVVAPVGTAVIVGGYILHLYCDNVGTLQEGKAIDSLGHVFGEFPHEFSDEFGSVCRTQARQAGWRLGRDGKALCPKCSGKPAPSEKAFSAQG